MDGVKTYNLDSLYRAMALRCCLRIDICDKKNVEYRRQSKKQRYFLLDLCSLVFT
ncbi:hypothetical protein M1M90_01550 [Thermodesulfovibrionales bacterium]|nr:hypothetical protein [Thermodesulfovibrionales bacterium]